MLPQHLDDNGEAVRAADVECTHPVRATPYAEYNERKKRAAAMRTSFMRLPKQADVLFAKDTAMAEDIWFEPGLWGCPAKLVYLVVQPAPPSYVQQLRDLDDAEPSRVGWCCGRFDLLEEALSEGVVLLSEDDVIEEPQCNRRSTLTSSSSTSDASFGVRQTVLRLSGVSRGALCAASGLPCSDRATSSSAPQELRGYRRLGCMFFSCLASVDCRVSSNTTSAFLTCCCCFFLLGVLVLGLSRCIGNMQCM